MNEGRRWYMISCPDRLSLSNDNGRAKLVRIPSVIVAFLGQQTLVELHAK